MRIIRLFIIALLSTLMAISCSSRNSDITLPDSNSIYSNSDSLKIGISDWDDGGNPIAGYGVLGIFEVKVDSKSLTGEITPLRQSSLTDVLEVVDITNFLSSSPCANCVKLNGVSIDADGNIILTVGIKHPFPVGNPSQPITGRNRADLHVFNIEGTVVGEAPSALTFPGIGESVANLRMVNADGYTPYLDDVIDPIFPTIATIHPYKLHFDDYSSGNFNPVNPMGFASVTDPPPSGNLVMAMGSDFNFQDYAFDLIPNENLQFLFTVGCAYGVSSASKDQRFSPEYRIPQHLKKAASEIDVRIPSNNLVDSDPASTATIEIDVVDISHGVAVGTALDQMLADSSVNDIELEIPGITSGLKSVPLVNIGGSGHSPSDPLTYSITITNETSATEGAYSGLVKVVDSYSPGLNTSPLLQGKDGIKRVGPTENPLTGLFDITEFATYQAFEIEVGPETGFDCPDAPYAGVTFAGDFTYTDYTLYPLTGDLDWNIHADIMVDTDILSTGNAVCIYSCGGDDGANILNGDMRYVDTDNNWTYTRVGNDYPGKRGMSIDIDSEDNVIFVTSTLGHSTQVMIPPSQRAQYNDDYFTVIDIFAGPSSAQQVNVGTRIMAIDIDAYDDVWVLDVEDVMHRYVKSSGYTEDTSRRFDLDDTTSGTFNELVHDFVIDFYSEAFFILTDNTSRRGNVWRIECNGAYNSTIGSNPNPLLDVLPQATFEMADIGIDNLDSSRNILTGRQDSQIVVVGSVFISTFVLDGMVARIDSELNQHQSVLLSGNSNEQGLSNVAFDQVQNELWGWQAGVYADSWIELWSSPSDWQ